MNAVVVNGAISAPGFALPRFLSRTAFVMNMRPGDARPVSGGASLRALASFRGTGVHAVAAIGNPQRFFDMLRLAPGAVVVADNILSHDLTAYVAHVRARPGVESMTLPVGKGLEVTRQV